MARREKSIIYNNNAHQRRQWRRAHRSCNIDRYHLDSYVLTNKITLNYIQKPEEQEQFFKQQLSICAVDYFDNYLIHNMGAVWYPLAEKYGTFEFIKQMRDEGYTRHIGFSFHGTADVLEEILGLIRRLKLFSFKSTIWIGRMQASNLASIMKRLKNTSYLSNQTVYYANISQTNGKASDCIQCGLCEKNCPQSLPICELLGKVASAME